MVSIPLGGITTKASGGGDNNNGNGNGSDNDDVSSISEGDRGEKWKKSRPAAFILYDRLLMKFKMLPMPLQLIVAFIIGYIIMTGIRQGMTNSNSASTRPRYKNYDAPPITWEKPIHVNDNEIKPRIIQILTNEKLDLELVMYSPLNHVTSNIANAIPKIGARKLKDKYIELPDMDMKRMSPPDELEKDLCHRLGDWQLDHKPTCNVIHEISFNEPEIEMPTAEGETSAVAEGDGAGEDTISTSLYKNYQLIAGGAFRHVWMFHEYDGTKRVLKTLRVDSEKKKFDLRSFDRHRRDSLSMDQLTWSPLIVDIYSYCTNSAIFDYGEGGDLTALFEKPKIIKPKYRYNGEKSSRTQPTMKPLPSKDTMLHIAYNVSLSLAHAHNPDPKYNKATIAHTDIKPNQFLYQDGYYKLTDFNRVRFLTYNDYKQDTCGFYVGKNGGIWRAPEEYAVSKISRGS